jgi:hypothetical protein
MLRALCEQVYTAKVTFSTCSQCGRRSMNWFTVQRQYFFFSGQFYSVEGADWRRIEMSGRQLAIVAPLLLLHLSHNSHTLSLSLSHTGSANKID